MPRKRLIKILRFSFSLLLLICFYFFGIEDSVEPTPISAEEPVLYATRCHDQLRNVYLEAILSAKESIYICMFSLNDPKLIQALKKKAAEGVNISIYHDTSTNQTGFTKLSSPIHVHPMPSSGLMHRKILIIDDTFLWIGSANFTTSSLCFDYNLVMGLADSQLANKIIKEKASSFHFSYPEQQAHYLAFPEKGKEGLATILKCINAAQKSIRVAMYTWTHPLLTEAVIQAHKRGVKVSLVLDHGQAFGVGMKTLKQLQAAQIDVRLNAPAEKRIVHHKFAWIDEKVLIHGSANWTQAAFKRNHESLLIFEGITEKQTDKLHELWDMLLRISEPLPASQKLVVFRDRPETFFYHPLESLDMVA